MKKLLYTSMMIAALGACETSESDDPRHFEKYAAGAKDDAWDSQNDPDRFRADLEYRLTELPLSGKTLKMPWTDTYWPTYEDSINVRWQGSTELSPAEKFDVAFNDWQPPEGFFDLKPYASERCEDKSWDRSYYDGLGPVAAFISQNKGNGKAHDGIDNDGDGEIDECDDRDGVETWFGLCHAWVPASILEDEPLAAVEHNGVTFAVSDIKALLIMAYDRSQAHMIGARCNDKEVVRDENGRIEADHCRDTNAGTFHVIVTNFLGKMQRAIAEDRTYNYEVWNQPIVDYDVKSQEEISKEKAIELLGLDGGDYIYNADAKRFVLVSMELGWIGETEAATHPHHDNIAEFTSHDSYTYILEMDEEGAIIGGEWLTNSGSGPHGNAPPDFLWLPVAPGFSTVPTLDIEKIRMLVRKSRATVEGDGTVSEFTRTPELTIPDNDTRGIADSLTVPNDLIVGGLTVDVDISHSFVKDLKLALTHNDITVILQKYNGTGQNGLTKTFEVKDFDGANARGEWTLKAVDNASADVGTLRSWKVAITQGR
jgi:hypothetical protein